MICISLAVQFWLLGVWCRCFSVLFLLFLSHKTNSLMTCELQLFDSCVIVDVRYFLICSVWVFSPFIFCFFFSSNFNWMWMFQNGEGNENVCLFILCCCLISIFIWVNINSFMGTTFNWSLYQVFFLCFCIRASLVRLCICAVFFFFFNFVDWMPTCNVFSIKVLTEWNCDLALRIVCSCWESHSSKTFRLEEKKNFYFDQTRRNCANFNKKTWQQLSKVIP